MWVVIIIVIILIAWWYFASLSAPATPTNAVNNAPVGEQTENTAATAAVSNATDSSQVSGMNDVPVSGLTTSSSDTSNAALNADLSSIDTQQSGLSDDTSNINQSFGTSTQ